VAKMPPFKKQTEGAGVRGYSKGFFLVLFFPSKLQIEG
jgi:hypothetical protein